MKQRKLNDVREFLTELTTATEKLMPEIRVTRQVIDLQLLKYAINKQGLIDPEIEEQIDTCIKGFKWLYENGGTHDKLPDIINTDAEAKEYYNTFGKAWSNLQEYMRLNMNLMDM